MAGRYDSNPFDEDDDIDPFADQAGKRKGSRQSNFGSGAFYMTNPGSVCPASSSKLSPLPHEPYDRGAERSRDPKRRRK